MHAHIDVTPLVNPTVPSVNVAPFMPREWEQGALIGRTEFGRTEFATKNVGRFEFFAPQTGPSAPTVTPLGAVTRDTRPASNQSAVSPATAIAPPEETDIDRIASERVKLMAAKYAASAVSSELMARLEILNRRLLDRAPRVSKEQVAALESANDQLARIQAAREERSRRLGIAVQQ